MKFLAVFLNFSPVEEKESYGLHLIPDVFMLVEMNGLQLQLYQIDYKDLQEILESDTEFLKQKVVDTGNVCFEGFYEEN
jgi:hypothetical protein